MKIAIIGGGNMGGAFAQGLVQSDTFHPEEITVTARSQETLSSLSERCPGIQTSLDNVTAIAGADYIVLAVKPWLIVPILKLLNPHIDHSKQIVISLAAGISFDQLTELLGENSILFRVIPNTAIAIRQSMTLVSACRASQEQIAQLLYIIDQLGKSILIDEKQMTAATALTSCGIAYAMQYIKAAMQGAIELGLYPHDARKMIDQTLLGAAELLEHNDSMPDAEILKVCTPGGITIKGLNAMTASGFDHAVIEGLKKAAGK